MNKKDCNNDCKEYCKEDYKRDYLAETFSRTKRKDYENYAINGIWARIDDLSIKPVTQQYVKRPDKRYALIDLYFPQFNIGVEIDEMHHFSEDSIYKDKERSIEIKDMLTEDILSALGTRVADNDIEHVIPPLECICMGQSIEDITQRMQEIAELVKRLKAEAVANGSFVPWDPAILDNQTAIANRRIAVEDNYFFRVNAEIRALFARSKNLQRGYYSLDKWDKQGREYYLWLPNLTAEGIPATGNWYNKLSKDWDYIYESNDDHCKLDTRPENILRVTFTRAKNALGVRGYKFVGVFEKTGLCEEGGMKHLEYKRVATELDLTPWLGQ